MTSPMSGVPNHQPDPSLPPQENHHTLTGSNTSGTLYPSICADSRNGPLNLLSLNTNRNRVFDEEDYNAAISRGVEGLPRSWDEMLTIDANGDGVIDGNEAHAYSGGEGEDAPYWTCYDDCIDNGGTQEECMALCADECEEENLLSSTCSDWTTADGYYPGGIDMMQTRNLISFGSSGRPRVGLSWPRAGTSNANWLSIFSAVGCAPGGQITPAGKDPTIPTVGMGGGYGGIYCFALNP